MKMVQTPVSCTLLSRCRPSTSHAVDLCSTSHAVDPSPSIVYVVEESLVVYKNTPQYFHRDYESGSGLVVLYRDFFYGGLLKATSYVAGCFQKPTIKKIPIFVIIFICKNPDFCNHFCTQPLQYQYTGIVVVVYINESGDGLVVLYQNFSMVGFSKQPATGGPAMGLPNWRQLALAS